MLEFSIQGTRIFTRPAITASIAGLSFIVNPSQAGINPSLLSVQR
jgi:hypothetical protein